ncbi:hypothetical protein SLNWT_3150 [Streptomyces albus]|uniref:Uncharacterized protein n=1 Tax=Streptomyces albus (strain ATCC 21838 / DSM 41398 / FERM P-419 / JCM 4703 / NBRC 107858) TaxID=1081613 RepID=A0A0B5EY08_STRA4|nr:hypothetical protein SLNWT_3150 [Streptomyces albus]AOU77834.1 hypothetical protein SLNHY_3143 [Streptomyces albus]AYN33594.1 hypothetical protein DUI70_3093 [Streptomyces albus]
MLSVRGELPAFGFRRTDLLFCAAAPKIPEGVWAQRQVEELQRFGGGN